MQQRYDKERKEHDSAYQRNIHQKESRVLDLENINKASFLLMRISFNS